MEVLSDDQCFVCGPANPQGLHANFVVDKEERRAHCVIRIPSQFQGWQGLVHGGILATLLDEAGVYACRATGEHFVTAELTVKYKLPVPVETELLVSAEVVEQKRKIHFVQARVEADGKLLAESSSRIFAITPRG